MAKIALAFCVILIGVIPVTPVINWVVWAGPVSSIASSLIGGAATGGAAGLSGNYAVTVTMNIENWTKYSLSNYAGTSIAGSVQNYPAIVSEGKRKTLRAHKTGGTATGSVGVVSWEIMGAGRRIAIMWSAPYSFDLHSNWLAVGLTNPGSTAFTAEWYDYMYYKTSNGAYGLNFKRKEYYRDTSQILFDDAQFQIVATMGTSHHPQINVHLRPKEWTDMSPTLKAKIIQNNSG